MNNLVQLENTNERNVTVLLQTVWLCFENSQKIDDWYGKQLVDDAASVKNNVSLKDFPIPNPLEHNIEPSVTILTGHLFCQLPNTDKNAAPFCAICYVKLQGSPIWNTTVHLIILSSMI